LVVATAACRFDANTAGSSAAEVVALGRDLAAAISALMAIVRKELAGIATVAG
jgi:hypothetical protein